MTLVELAELVEEMRSAQKVYFKSRSLADLERSKALERELDKVVAVILVGPGLFDEAEAKS